MPNETTRLQFESIREFSRRANCSPRTTQRLIRDGKLKAYRISTNRVALNSTEADAYLLSCEVV